MYILEIHFKNDILLKKIDIKIIENILKNNKEYMYSDYLFYEKNNIRMYNPFELNMYMKSYFLNIDKELKKKLESLNFVKSTRVYYENIQIEDENINISIENLNNIIYKIDKFFNFKNISKNYKKYLNENMIEKFNTQILKLNKNKNMLKKEIYNLKTINLEKEMYLLQSTLNNYKNLLSINSQIVINYSKNLKIDKILFNKIKESIVDKIYYSLLSFTEYDNTENFKIELNFKQKSENLIIEIIEIGKSIDVDKIYQKLLNNNLLKNNIDYNENEILRSIFNISFINTEKNIEIKENLISNIRLNKIIETLNGNILVENEKDNFFKISLIIPLMEIYLNSYIFKEDGKYYAIDKEKVIKVLKFDKNKIRLENTLKYYDYKGMQIAYLELPIKKDFKNRIALLLKMENIGYTIIDIPINRNIEEIFLERKFYDDIILGNGILKNGKNVSVLNIEKIIKSLREKL